MIDYHIYWGDMHDNTYSTAKKSREGIVTALERARSHLDFYAAAYYTSWAETYESVEDHIVRSDAKQRIAPEDWKDPERIAREWADVQDGTRRFNEDGCFTTFPGYEWQGDASSGDHNVFFRTEGGPVCRVDTLPELYRCLEGYDAIAIPHHTAYRVGLRGKDWSLHDDVRSPFAEVYSVHGSSEVDDEWIGLRCNSHMGPGFGAGTYQAGLDSGLHIGALCSTDNWGCMPGCYGHGLAACLAPALTRESLWEAFHARRVYGVTGDRIKLDVRVNDATMGSIIKSQGPRRIRVHVRGLDELDRIEILRGGRVIHTHCHQGTWRIRRPGECGRFVLRVECGWGPRPNELPVRERSWAGRVIVSGGRILSATPCWISEQPGCPVCSGAAADFALVTSTSHVSEPVQNSNVFEFSADPSGMLRVELNGLSAEGTVAEFCSGSRELWFREEAVKMLADEAGLDPTSVSRQDIYHHLGYKAKLHRAIPEAGYTATVDFEDDTPLEGETHYRVRVEQRNGQRAWSSPIWVMPA
ncbi:MAG: DUF3604 domain-containing protein [Candidatus Pacebacteria bacterium]|nr:DUF3604 domain-containing protein [Candidatus Paceibacterota bacterium]